MREKRLESREAPKVRAGIGTILIREQRSARPCGDFHRRVALNAKWKRPGSSLGLLHLLLLLALAVSLLAVLPSILRMLLGIGRMLFTLGVVAFPMMLGSGAMRFCSFLVMLSRIVVFVARHYISPVVLGGIEWIGSWILPGLNAAAWDRFSKALYSFRCSFRLIFPCSQRSNFPNSMAQTFCVSFYLDSLYFFIFLPSGGPSEGNTCSSEPFPVRAFAAVAINQSVFISWPVRISGIAACVPSPACNVAGPPAAARAIVPHTSKDA
jgi:hypothetical protein